MGGISGTLPVFCCGRGCGCGCSCGCGELYPAGIEAIVGTVILYVDDETRRGWFVSTGEGAALPAAPGNCTNEAFRDAFLEAVRTISFT